MKTLSQALSNIRITVDQSDKSNAISSTLLPGSTTGDGKTSISFTKRLQNQSTNEQKRLSGLLKDTPEHQKRLNKLLLVCFDTMDNYGKEPEQLYNFQEAFQMVLGKYTMLEVADAFREYMETKTVMPKPADIVKIIDPSVEVRKWSAVAFIDIRRRSREGQFITRDERQYCDDYLAAQIECPDAREDRVKTLSQIEKEDKQYWLDG